MKKYIFLGLTIIVFFNFIPTLHTQEISQPQEIPEGYIFYQYSICFSGYFPALSRRLDQLFFPGAGSVN